MDAEIGCCQIGRDGAQASGRPPDSGGAAGRAHPDPGVELKAMTYGSYQTVNATAMMVTHHQVRYLRK